MQSKFSTLFTHTYTASLNFNSKMLDCVKTHHHWTTRVYHSWSFAKACGERESCVRETFLYTSLRNSQNLNFMFLFFDFWKVEYECSWQSGGNMAEICWVSAAGASLPSSDTLTHFFCLSCTHTRSDTLITCANIFLLPCVFARYSCSCRLLFFLNFWIFLFSSFAYSIIQSIIFTSSQVFI